jgi:hypothetical protein
MVEAVCTSETSVYCNETTRYYITEGSHLHVLIWLLSCMRKQNHAVKTSEGHPLAKGVLTRCISEHDSIAVRTPASYLVNSQVQISVQRLGMLSWWVPLISSCKCLYSNLKHGI